LRRRAALAKLVLEPPPGLNGVVGTSSRSSADALETLEAQAKVFNDRAGTPAPAPAPVLSPAAAAAAFSRKGKGEEEDPTLELSRGILATAARVRDAAAATFRQKRKRGGGGGMGGGGGGGSEGRYVRAMKDLLFGDAPLLRDHNHHFKTVASAALPGGEASRKRSQKIQREVSSLPANLPLFWGSTICVRSDEHNMGALRALILPPADTPYGGGAFEFDIFLPANYPNACPKVHFLTTGGGTVRFNPNLYDCGKVCLSLLGTWEGPGWDPKVSTLNPKPQTLNPKP